tara:strand:+ start:3766 stop:4152 length:387 start_codon:yes stop_codon:yes gene_type:complete
MNLKVEEILMVVIAFLIGWFLRTMISGSSSGSGSSVKAVGGKHESTPNATPNATTKTCRTDSDCDSYNCDYTESLGSGVCVPVPTPIPRTCKKQTLTGVHGVPCALQGTPCKSRYECESDECLEERCT